MGLPRGAICLLLREGLDHPFAGRIATLGRQHVYLSLGELTQMASRMGFPLAQVTPTLHRDPILRSKGFLSDDSLYAALGFDQSCRIDRSAYEDCDEQLDLNAAETPAPLCDAFDVVLDSGTVEHVFELGRSLEHCLNMARPNGRIIHLTPSSNAVNHGFYSVSPTLYHDFYRASGCVVEKLWLCQAPRRLERGSWKAYDCMSTDRNWLPLGRLGNGIWFTFAVIRKLADSHAAIPQQSFYMDTWKAAAMGQEQLRSDPSASLVAGVEGESPNTRAGQLLKATERNALLHHFARALISIWRRYINSYREWRLGKIPFKFVGKF